MTKSEIEAEAIDRARNGQSVANYVAIYEGFMAKGIAEADIKPRENVFTFHAWKALGRSVKKGEHGVKVVTFIEASARGTSDNGEETVHTYRKPHTTTVFHISQTELEGERQARRPAADYRTPRRSAWASGHGRYPSVDSYPDPGELAADRWNETH
jgi:hypothetical protein